MNKSKFLKKSLAMLLALMLVVAMIPLSASAAGEAPAVAEVRIDGKVATLSGTTYSAEIVEPGTTEKVKVKVTLKNDTGNYGVAYYTGLEDSNQVATKENGAYVFYLEPGVTSATFYTTDSQSAKSEPYTVTFTTVEPSDDTSIKSVHIIGDTGKEIEYDVYNDDIANFVIVAPYGWKVDPTQIHITANAAPDATVSPIEWKNNTPGYNVLGNFTVTAQSGRTTNYTVMVVKPIPFKSFAIEDERHESQISRVTLEPKFQVNKNDPQVEVYLPYGYEGSEFTPVFETNYSVKVWANDVGDVLIESGKTYDWNDLGATVETDKDVIIPLMIEYSDHTKERWTLNLDGLTKDVVAAIKGLTVDNYVATIDGTTITLTIPSTVREDADSIEFTASPEMEVEILNTGIKRTADADEEGLLWLGNTGLLAKEDSYILRVTAPAAEFDADPANTRMVQDYDLNIVTAQVEKPKLNSMILQSEVTGEKIVGTINKDSVVFNDIPYRYKRLNTDGTNKALQDDEWVLLWTASEGCTITNSEDGDPIALSGSGVEEFGGILPWGYDRYQNTKGDYNIVLENANGQTASYFVVFNSAKASQDSELTTLELAENGVYDLEDVTDLNTTELVVDNVAHTISAKIWFNEWEKYVLGDATVANGFYRGGTLVGELPAGSELYFVFGDQVWDLEVLNENHTTIENPTNVLPTAKNKNDGIDYGMAHHLYEKASYCTGKTPLQIIVVSEAGAESITDQDYYSDAEELIKDGFATKYELTLEQKEPRTETNLDKVSIYDAYTGTRVYAQIKNGEINFELPYYFIDSLRKSEDSLYLDYEPIRGGVTLTKGNAILNPLSWNADDELVTDKCTRLIYDERGEDVDLYTLDPNGSWAWLDTITVVPESPTANKQVYDVNLTITEPKEDGVLNSVTLDGSTGTPNDKNEVTVNVPFATEITSLNPDFNISENAFVVEGKVTAADLSDLATDKNPIVDEDETFNFTQPRTFTVVSEDHHELNTYTITVEVSDQFVDVTSDQWFYDEVMTAAGKGWVNGQGDGKFNPNGTMTRADFALIVARIMGYNEADYPTSAFPDVDSDQYYSAAVAFCKAHNIIDGDDKGNFNPTDAITREQMAKILCQAKQLKVTVPEKTFDDDAKIAEWAKGYVYACQEAGIMEGDNGSFRPTDNATRAEGAAVLVRAFA